MTTTTTTTTATTALIPADPDSWRPILQVSNQVVLYNPTSHALSVNVLSRQYNPLHHHSHNSHQRRCPYCNRTLPPLGVLDEDGDEEDLPEDDLGSRLDPTHQARAANYFHLLELSNLTDAGSRPASPPKRTAPLPAPQVRQPVSPSPSPPSSSSASRTNGRTGGFPAEAMAEGYFKAFFQEEYKLGMGANGSVFLCQHLLDGTPLGHFAVKKIAVGESHSYLLKILREVRLLEQMRHPNIITYHHAWLESCQFSAFGPKVPTLHVLMQWAEGGSLDDFIDVRLGRHTKHIHVGPLARFSSRTRSGLSPFSSVPGTPTTVNPPTLASPAKSQAEDPDDDSAGGAGTSDIYSRSARIRAFREYQRASPEEKERMKREVNQGSGPSWKAVHLLSAEEVKSLFSDVVEGLAFLHEKSILHLDLKPGNVLLTWDEGLLIPRAMLSDFGTSRDMMNTSRVRSGNTGTLEYTSPESLPSPETGLLRQIDSKADMWSLGMILHKMLFFRLPYRYAADGNTQGHPLSAQEEGDKLEKLEKEVLNYPGFKTTPTMVTAFQARRIPRSFSILLESLLNVTPLNRLSVERIATALKEGRFDPQEPPLRREFNSSTLSLSPVLVAAPPVRPSSPPATASEPSTPVGDSGSVQPQVATVTATQRFAMEMTRERVKLLGPPEGVGVDLHPDDAGWRRTRFGAERVMAKVLRVRMGRETYVRMVKSWVLSVKVLTISRACFQESLDLEQGSLRGWNAWSQSWVLVLLAMAMLDTMSDEMWLSAVLFLAHIMVMKLVCGGVY